MILRLIFQLRYTGYVSESGDFATLFFSGSATLGGGCRYRHFAANFKAF